MQGSMLSTSSTVVERPLRRVSSVRAAISDLQTHLESKNPSGSAHHASAIQRQDSSSKLDKPDRPALLLPGGPPASLSGLLLTARTDSATGGGTKVCDTCHHHVSSSSSSASGDSCCCACCGSGGVVMLPRRLHSAEQAARKSRVLATCCISGLLSLFLFLQIVSGGFGVFFNPLTTTTKVSTLSQMQSALVSSDVQINVLREDSYTESDILLGKYWRPLSTPHKEVANNKESEQQLRDSHARNGQQKIAGPEKPAKPSGTAVQAYHTGPPIPVLGGDEQQQVRGGADTSKDSWKPWQLPGVALEVDLPLPSSSGGQGGSSRATPVAPRDEALGSSLLQPASPFLPLGGVDQSAPLDQAKWELLYPWAKPLSHKFKQCIEPAPQYKKASEESNGYIMMFANGGLNQMRTGICDMVAVARVLNATLVIPELDHTSYWADPSDFGKVFDVENFVKTLENDVKVVHALPDHLREGSIYEVAPRSWSEPSYYVDEILPLLKEHGVIRFTLTDSRLANNRIDPDIQRLRCRANYRALTFHPDIRDLADKIIHRLRSRGPFIALHLRYEKDMLAFSGCTHGLSAREAAELRAVRYNVSRWKEKEIDPAERRAQGLCPLTPREVGVTLEAMRYPLNTLIYVAAGQIYGGERRMRAFTAIFPNVVTKETVASPEELAPFKDYQNRMAALDYLVAVASDVFVPTYDGNMARAVQGHRRFLGHKRTLMPDRVALVRLLDAYRSRQLSRTSLRRQVQEHHRNRQGAHHERKPLSPSRVKQEENFYANPSECFCRTAAAAVSSAPPSGSGLA